MKSLYMKHPIYVVSWLRFFVSSALRELMTLQEWFLCRSWHFPKLRKSLEESLSLLHASNLALARERGFQDMTDQRLQQVRPAMCTLHYGLPDSYNFLKHFLQLCLQRGLLVSNLQREDMELYLKNFIGISENLDGEVRSLLSESKLCNCFQFTDSGLTLLLHSHVLLSYGFPDNQKHLYKYKV